MSEEQALLDEITEEVKHDQFVKFVKKHQSTITGIMLGTVACIVMYTSWKSRVKRDLQQTSQALFQAATSGEQGRLVLKTMVEKAPAKLVPVIEIILAGSTLSEDTPAEEKDKVNKMLLDLSQQNGVPTEWKDLAIMVYASHYSGTDLASVIEKLKPLTENGRPFRLSAKELIGVLYMTLGNKDEALKMLDQVKSDPETPQTMAERCEVLKLRILK